MKFGIKNRETNIGLETGRLENDWRWSIVRLLPLVCGLCHLKNFPMSHSGLGFKDCIGGRGCEYYGVKTGWVAGSYLGSWGCS